jgi:alkylmercury lyase
MNGTNCYASIPVPDDLRACLGKVLGLQRAPVTLGDVVDRMRAREALVESDLCCSGPSHHLVRMRGGQSRYTHCIIDALLLPILEDTPAEIESESPLGGVIRMTVTPDGVHCNNPEVVVSFGVARASRGPVQQMACPYINAFPSRAEYERWAAVTPEAITMALPLADAFAFARHLATHGNRDTEHRAE